MIRSRPRQQRPCQFKVANPYWPAWTKGKNDSRKSGEAPPLASIADTRQLQAFARQLGYAYVEIAPAGPFGGLPLSEAPLAVTVCTLAADHLPVFADLNVPTAVVAQTLRIADAARAEGQTGTSPLTFTLTLNPKSAGPVTVRYATANGTAQAGSDYVAKSGSLTFPVGQRVQTVSVVVRGDRVKEGNETFFVNLSGATGATVMDGRGVGTIGNDD